MRVSDERVAEREREINELRGSGDLTLNDADMADLLADHREMLAELTRLRTLADDLQRQLDAEQRRTK